ncbi:MAG TPA: hypothetical protein PKW05_14020, partial [Anaerolineae bacterium]|nr:hypothetical protein [Anaerolineae bacterium]
GDQCVTPCVGDMEVPTGDMTVHFSGVTRVALPQIVLADVLADVLAEGRNVDGWIVLEAQLVEVTVTEGMATVLLAKGVA